MTDTEGYTQIEVTIVRPPLGPICPPERQSVTIREGASDLCIVDMMDRVIIPTLLALGYHPNSIEEYFGD